MLKLLLLWSNHSRIAIYCQFLNAAASIACSLPPQPRLQQLPSVFTPLARFLAKPPGGHVYVALISKTLIVIPLRSPASERRPRERRVVVGVPEGGTRSWRPGCHGKQAIIIEVWNTVVFEAV